jgi:hypothetical protein
LLAHPVPLQSDHHASISRGTTRDPGSRSWDCLDVHELAAGVDPLERVRSCTRTTLT